MSNVTRSGYGEGPDNIDIKVWIWLGRHLGYEPPCVADGNSLLEQTDPLQPAVRAFRRAQADKPEQLLERVKLF